MYKKSKGLHNSFLNQSNKRATFKSENWTPRKLSAINKIQYNLLKSFQNNKNTNNLDSNRKNDIKILSDISYKNLETYKGKRTTNISLNESNSSKTNSSKEDKKLKNSKNFSVQVSALLSPNKKINIIEKNKK